MRPTDRFLVGVDTPHGPHKPPAVIERAYNDGCGVTAAFTLNALRHVNSIAGTDFDWRAGWRHVAEYDEELRAIRTHVAAVGPQTVSIDGKPLRSFADGERIFMEQSRKFDLRAVRALAAAAGLAVARHWSTDDGYHLLVELELPSLANV